jgi:predicted PurR-regulated permease PerM
MRLTSRLLTGLGAVLSNALLILISVVFMLLEAAVFRQKLQDAFGSSEPSLEKFNSFFTSINRYIVIKTGASLATGLLAYILLLILGVDYALLWALFTFLLNYIPNIGSIMASIPPILLALIQSGPWLAIGTAVGYFSINTLIGSILEPRILGKGLGLSTLVVFLSLVFWGWVLGPVGMLLSVPLTMTLKIALSASDETNWLSTMLDATPGRRLPIVSGDPDSEG